MRAFTAEAKTDAGVSITVEYHYDRHDIPVIDGAERCGDQARVILSEAERTRIEDWICETLAFEDLKR